jgi:hypothetical protein
VSKPRSLPLLLLLLLPLLLLVLLLLLLALLLLIPILESLQEATPNLFCCWANPRNVA